MPTPEQAIIGIANQMMKGNVSCKNAPGTSKSSRDRFVKKYEVLIRLIAPQLPRDSFALGAVVTKCALKYGLDKAVDFCKALKSANFKGDTDPVCLYYMFMVNNHHKRLQPNYVYKVAGFCVKAYCEGRTIKRIRPMKGDIFEWNKSTWEPIP